MAFTELYCDPTHASASNTNAGSTTGAPVATFTGGNWTAASDTYVKAGADMSGVTVGMYAALMTDGGTVAVYIGRVATVNDGTDTITLTATAGADPGNLAGNATLTIGGVWDGPAGASVFPFSLASLDNLKDASSNEVCINLRNTATYSITAAITQSGTYRIEGYTTTAHDGGRATIDAGGSNINILATTGANCEVVSIIAQNNGTGTSAAFSAATGNGIRYENCAANTVRGAGFTNSVAGTSYLSCEAYLCNAANTANIAGFVTSTDANYILCDSHDNAGSNTSGYFASGGSIVTYTKCWADTNEADGWRITASRYVQWLNCDSYNNGGDGIDLQTTTVLMVHIINTNFISNASNIGINGSGSAVFYGAVINCGFFGQATTTTGTDNVKITGSVNYSAQPYNAPTTGDFRVTLPAARNAGYGSFAQTQASYTGTSDACSIGAAVWPPGAFSVVGLNGGMQ